jgi:hypothetical protein
MMEMVVRFLICFVCVVVGHVAVYLLGDAWSYGVGVIAGAAGMGLMEGMREHVHGRGHGAS